MGPRKAVLYEIGVLPAFISRVMSSPPDPSAFRKAADAVIEKVEGSLGWLYSVVDPEGEVGHIRYTVWSDVLECPACLLPVTLWDACVSRKPARIAELIRCPLCQEERPVSSCRRIVDEVDDVLLSRRRKVRRRSPAWIYGTTRGKSWSRAPIPADYDLLKRIEAEALPTCIPRVRNSLGRPLPSRLSRRNDTPTSLLYAAQLNCVWCSVGGSRTAL